MDLSVTPPEWENWLSENMVPAYSEQRAPWVALHGWFEGERFVPVKAQWVESGEATNQYAQWNVIFDRSNGEPQPETLMLRF